MDSSLRVYLFGENALKSLRNICQSAITCSKLTTKTLEQDVKYVQS